MSADGRGSSWLRPPSVLCPRPLSLGLGLASFQVSFYSLHDSLCDESEERCKEDVLPNETELLLWDIGGAT